MRIEPKKNTLKTVVNGKWRTLPGKGKDITIDYHGRVWMLGTNGKLYEWKYDTYWKPYGGQNGVRISAGKSEIYITSTNGYAYKGPLPKFVPDPGPKEWRIWLQSAATQKCLTNKIYGLVDANAHLTRVTTDKCDTNLKWGDQQFFVRNIDSKDNKKVKFLNARNGLCLAIAFGARGNRAALVNMICRKSSNQTWIKYPGDKGKIRLQNAASKLCLKVDPKTASPYQYKCSKTDKGQQFAVHNIDKTPPRHHKKPAAAKKKRKDWKFSFALAGSPQNCLNDIDHSKPNGRAGVWPCTKKDKHEQFRLLRVKIPKHKLTRVFQIRNGGGLCLAASKSLKSSSLLKKVSMIRSVKFVKCSGKDPRHAWNLEVGERSEFLLRNAGVNECLSLGGKSPAKRTPFTIQSCDAKTKIAFRFDRTWVN